MSDEIRTGVIGVGALGRHHARLYRFIEKAEVTGIYDSNPDQAQKISSEFGIPVFTTIPELLEQVQAVSVAVPTDLHFEVVQDILKKGVHVLVEKPITETVEQGRKLLELADQNGLILQVGHVERFNPVTEFLDKKLKSPKFIEAHRLAPYPPPRPGLKPRGTEVGVVLDLMIHDIELVMSLVKRDIVSIEAVGVPVLSGTEDIANARLTFEGGCVANLTASRVTSEPMRKLRLFEPNRYMSLDYGAKNGFIFSREGGQIIKESVPITDHNALEMELRHFIDCVHELTNEGTPPVSRVSGKHGLRALEIAVEITRKIAEAQ